MSEPGGGVIGVKTRRRGKWCQNKEEGFIDVRTRKRSYRYQNQK